MLATMAGSEFLKHNLKYAIDLSALSNLGMASVETMSPNQNPKRYCSAVSYALLNFQ